LGTEVKDEVVDEGFVREVPVRTGKRGRNPTMLELTKKGRAVLEAYGYDVSKTGRRGIEHVYWQEQIKEFYEAEGFDVTVEFSVDEGRIDVYAERDGEAVAIEVARSPEHELENIEKCLGFGVDRVRVVYLEKRVRDRIEAAVQQAFGEVPSEVEFVPASEFTER
jgi:hypothetical protein